MYVVLLPLNLFYLGDLKSSNSSGVIKTATFVTKINRVAALLSILLQFSAQSDLWFNKLSYPLQVHDNGNENPSDVALIRYLKELLSLSQPK